MDLNHQVKLMRRGSGGLELSRVSVRGTLTDAHNEITRTQVEALNSTPW